MTESKSLLLGYIDTPGGCGRKFNRLVAGCVWSNYALADLVAPTAGHQQLHREGENETH